MIKRLLIFIFLSCCLALPSLAVSGTTLDPASNLFSPRQLGMGNVSIAFSDDAAGVFFNPAGLAKIKLPQLTGASRKLMLDETEYIHTAWAAPTKWGVFGLGYVAMGTGGSLPTKRDPVTSRIVLDPSSEATSYSNSVIALSYARALRPNLSVGANLKLFSQAISGGLSSQATGTGIDLSAAYQANNWLTVGANLQNIISGGLKWSGGSEDKIGGYYKLGAKINILGPKNQALRTHQHKLNAGIDIDLPNNVLARDNSMLYHFGLEYTPINNIFFRAGLNQDGNGSGLTYGIGIVNGGFRFDYAYVARSGIPGDNPHYFSLSYIGETKKIVSTKVKKKASQIKINSPKDRTITASAEISLSAEAYSKIIMDQTTIWQVTAISETKEVKEITKTGKIDAIYLNGTQLPTQAQIRSTPSLEVGRNILQLFAFTSPESVSKKGSLEVSVTSAEVKILRFHPFKDTPMDHWAIEPIALAVTLGLVNGYPDDTFRPNKGITRAELVTLLVRSKGLRLDLQPNFINFTDVPSTSWAAKFISYASENFLVTGYPDGSFKPNKVLSRAEGITIFSRYADLSTEAEADLSGIFPDLPTDYWANKYIAPAYKAGLLGYLKGKDFEPSKPFSRAEACEILYRTPMVQEKTEEFWETGSIRSDFNVSAEATTTSTEAAVIETRLATIEAEIKPISAEAAPVNLEEVLPEDTRLEAN